MKFVKRSEIERMANNVIDEETGMTELDYYEWCHPYEDITIIDDTEKIINEEDVIDVEIKVIKSKIVKKGKR